MTSTAYQRIEFRCNGKVHAVRKEFPNGKVLLEVRCKDKRCADRNVGEVVFHYYNIETGFLDHTKKFKDPAPLDRIRNTGERLSSSQENTSNLNGR